MTRNQFRAARQRLGLTQKKLAPLMGMYQQGVARIESGERQPTKQHGHTMRLLIFIHKHGLLDDLLDFVKKDGP